MNHFVLAFFIGGICAVVVLVGMKLITGRLVRRLLQERACDSETARTPDELGLGKDGLLRLCLRLGGGNIVLRHEEGRYWVPEEKTEKAAVLYNNSSLSFITIFTMLAMIVVIMFAVNYFGGEVMGWF